MKELLLIHIYFIRPITAGGMMAMPEKLVAENGLIFDIQSYSVHDGPGCRTTFFFAGCFLKCLWCANPESWNFKKKIMLAKSKCQHQNGCTRCLKACEKAGISVTDKGELQLDWEKCRQCKDFRCADSCYTEALKICGRRYTSQELLRLLNRDRSFWGVGGGVTFSGGEPFYQKEFLANVAEQCKAAYIHTAIETTAYVNSEDFLSTMAYIDFAFIDIKHMDSVRHKEQTGVDNELILSNIRKLANSGWAGRLVLRMPVIKGFNDSFENSQAIANFMDELGLFEINLLPFHRLGDSKWEQLGGEYAYKAYHATSQEKLAELQAVFLNRKIACYVGSETAF
jgi:glycyl-radical enzyme activating protein